MSNVYYVKLNMRVIIIYSFNVCFYLWYDIRSSIDKVSIEMLKNEKGKPFGKIRTTKAREKELRYIK